MAMKHSLVVASILLSVLLGSAKSWVITLGDIEDQGIGVWTDITCRHYLNTSEYLNAHGCYNNGVGGDLSDHRWKPENETDEFFEGHVGMWGPCSKKTCEIIYYGGELEQPEAISVSGLFSGTGKVEIFARQGVSNGEWRVLGNLTLDDSDDWTSTEWLETSVDNSAFSKTDYVFRFLVTTTGIDSLALIDKIEIDLGENVSEPTTTTVRPPGPPKEIFALDFKSDVAEDPEWTSVTCNYIPRHEDFWVYGCPNNVSLSDFEHENEEDDEDRGYWTPCNSYNCEFIFSSGEGRPLVQLLSLNGYFRDDARITVSRKSRKPFAKFEHLLTVNSSEIKNNVYWNRSLPNDCGSDIYNISISGAANNVIVDKVTVKLHDSNTCTIPQPTTPKPGVTFSTTPSSAEGVHSIMSTFTALILATFVSLTVFHGTGQ